MLSTGLRRALLESRLALPPTFLLPWTAGLSTTSVPHTTYSPPPPPPNEVSSIDSTRPMERKAPNTKAAPVNLSQVSKKLDLAPEVEPRVSVSTGSTSSAGSASPLKLSRSVRDLLPLLQAQSPHYITVHIHGNPYLLTEGDTVRLPFLMHDVEPGDVIRLTRAVNIGSRDFTLKAPAPTPKLKSLTKSKTLGDTTTELSLVTSQAPHFIPHIAKGKHSYVDDRLFICRAVVMGVESEPLRIKEKTKRRQRHTRRVKSKHRYTVLKIKELRVRSADDIEGEQQG